MDNTEMESKKVERSPDERHTYKKSPWKMMRHFDIHRSLCQSEESEYKWTHNEDGTIWQFQIRATTRRNKEGRGGGDRRTRERELREVNIRAASWRWNEW